MTVKIYHNPQCGTSRNVLAIIRAAGYEPQIIDYIHTGWERSALEALLHQCALTPREALRTSKSPAQDLGLLAEDVSNEAIVKAMIDHPVLVNRPIVVTPKGAKLCRPSEVVLDLLETWPAGPFYKEDGKLMIDEDGRRV